MGERYEVVALQLCPTGEVKRLCPGCATVLFFSGLLEKVGDFPLTFYTPDCRVITYAMTEGVTEQQCAQFMGNKGGCHD
jgi:hypothetical protein